MPFVAERSLYTTSGVSCCWHQVNTAPPLTADTSSATQVRIVDMVLGAGAPFRPLVRGGHAGAAGGAAGCAGGSGGSASTVGATHPPQRRPRGQFELPLGDASCHTEKDAQRGGSWSEGVPSAPWALWTHAPASSMLPAPAVRRHQCIRWPVARHIVCKQPTPQHSLPRSRRRPHPPTALGQAVVLRRRRPWSLPLGEGTPSFMYHAEWAVTVLVNCKTECLADCHDSSCTEGQAP